MNRAIRTVRRAAGVMVAGVMMAGLVAACSSDAGAPADGGADAGEAPAEESVKVAVLPIIDVAPVYLGVEQGFFEEEGLDVEIQTANSGAATIASLLAGEVQFAFTGVIPMMTAREQGVPIVPIANSQLQNQPEEHDALERGNADILVAGDSEIQDAADLEGATVAVGGLKGVPEVLLRNTLDVAGVPQDSVELVELGLPTMVDAVANRTVDAAFINEPFETIGLGQGLRVAATPFLDLEYAANLSMYVTTEEYLASDEDVVERFGRAMNKSLVYAQENPDEARQMVLSYTEVPEAVIAEVILPYWTPEVSVDSVEEQAELSVEYEVLSSMPDIDELLANIVTD